MAHGELRIQKQTKQNKQTNKQTKGMAIDMHLLLNQNNAIFFITI
jgi:hypothetical protein